MNTYDSIQRASKATGIKAAEITQSANDKANKKTAGGFIWNYQKLIDLWHKKKSFNPYINFFQYFKSLIQKEQQRLSKTNLNFLSRFIQSSFPAVN